MHHLQLHTIRCGMTALALATLASAALAEPFKLQCEVEGRLSENTTRLSPARVVVEIQAIGRHLYFNVVGPPMYAMRLSTLETEEFKGENLTSGLQLGARRVERRTQTETQLLIERTTMELSVHADVQHAGKAQRFSYTGKCRPQ